MADDLNKRQFIGGASAYKASAKNGFDVSTYASSYKKKKEDDEQKKIESDAKAYTAKLEAEKNKPNTFLEDTKKNIGDFFNSANKWLGEQQQPEFVNRAVNEGHAKVDEAVKRGELTQDQADQLKNTVSTMTGVGKTATEQFGDSITAKTARTAAGVLTAPIQSAKDLGEQQAGANQYASILDEMRTNGDITEKDYVEQKANENVKGLNAAGLAMPNSSGIRVLSPEADAKVKAKVKERTGVDYGFDKLIQAGLETASSVPIVGGTAKAAQVGTKEAIAAGKAIEDTAKAAQVTKTTEKLTEAQKSGPKLLSEPGESFYKAERDTAQQELDAINNLDANYLRENKLTTQIKDDARLKAEQTAASPQAQAARQEAAKVVTQAEGQVKYYNNLKSQSPYHKIVDQATAEKDQQIQQIIQGVQEGTFDPNGARQVADEISKAYEVKIANAAQRYPDQAQEAPMLDDALKQATMQHIEAQSNLEKTLADETTSIQQSGGMLETPDIQKIQARKQELETKLADIDQRVTSAKERATNPYAGNAEAIDQRIDDIQDPELSPENFDEAGQLTPEAKTQVAEATAARYEKVVTGNVDVPGGLANPTDGTVAKNATAEKLLDSDVISPEAKSNIKNLTHETQKDSIIKQNVRELMEKDPEAARQLYLGEELASTNPNSQVALGNALMRYYDRRPGMTKELGEIIDAQIGYASAAGAQLRQVRSMYQKTPSYIIRLAAKNAEDAGKPLTERVLNNLNKTAEEIKNMPEGVGRATAILALRDAAQSAGPWGQIRKWGSAVLSLPRGLLATGDLSFVLRQGLYAGTSHPIIWGKTLAKSARYAVSPKYYAEDMAKVASLADKNGESLAGAFKEMKLTLDGVTGKTDEVFGKSADILESKAAKKLGVGHLIAASDRAYTGAATYMRSQIAKSMVDGMGGVKAFSTISKKGKTDIGRVIDTSTGRGRGGDPLGDRSWFESAAPALSDTLFAARFWKSNIDKINPLYYAQLSGPAKKEALKNLASFGTTIATVLGAASAVGADVETDPRSSDFGKIKIGDTRFDIMGGLQQNIVLAAREITGEKKNVNGDIQKLGEDPYGPNRLSVLGDTVQNKTSPLVNTATTFLEGKDMAGNEIDPWKEIAGMFIPLGVQSGVDTYKNSGGDAGLTAASGAANFFGIGSNTYGSNNEALSASDKAKVAEAPAQSQDMYKAFYQAAGNVTGRTTRDKMISELYDQGKVEQARRKAAEFNANVDLKMKDFFAKYPNLDEDLQDELKNNVKITITPKGEKRRLK